MRYFLMAFLSLAACSGGGGSTTAVDPIDELPTVIEPEPDPAPTGRASYRGPIGLTFTPQSTPTVQLDGTLALAVDFDATAEAVTGEASGFTTASNGTVDGRLFLSGGALDDSQPALEMAGQLSGSLRSGTTGYLVFGQLTGEVQGDTQSAIVGNVAGTVRESGRDVSLTGQFTTGRLP